MPTASKTRLGVVTVGRSDYGIYRPLLVALADSPTLETTLLAGGMHLDPAFGHSIDEIRSDGYADLIEVPFSALGDDALAIGVSMGDGVRAFSKALAGLDLDLVIVLGDRFEMFAAAAATVPFALPLLHIHGGELTFGAMDDAFRHAITKFSHLHAVATEAYRRRVIQLGERPDRVHTVGALSLDDVTAIEPMSRSQLEHRFDIDLTIDPILVTFHPTTRGSQDAVAQQNEMLRALDDTGKPVVFTLPNADQGGRTLRQHLEEWVAARSHWRLVENFGKKAYFSMLRHVELMVGNSSSGLIEAPTFHLPVVNIGERQAGRLRGLNVIDVGCESHAIGQGIQSATSETFRSAVQVAENPYWNGGAVPLLLKLLNNLPARADLLAKGFVDQPCP
jgi:GDP/UDP-N,N'-diacetylbacillosamine 2-epimerase (hydrolysing)